MKRSPVRSISAKRAAAHPELLKAGRTVVSTKRVKARNAKRRQSEFERAYHSKERVEFVKALPCVVCGRTGCDNAHIEGDGASHKANYDKIVPLCMARSTLLGSFGGCHREAHGGIKTFAEKYGLDLSALAAATEAAWQLHLHHVGALPW